jgi:hypothetical protein
MRVFGVGLAGSLAAVIACQTPPGAPPAAASRRSRRAESLVRSEPNGRFAIAGAKVWHLGTGTVIADLRGR